MSNSQYYERVDDQKAQDLSKEIGTYPNVVHLLIVDVLSVIVPHRDYQHLKIGILLWTNEVLWTYLVIGVLVGRKLMRNMHHILLSYISHTLTMTK